MKRMLFSNYVEDLMSEEEAREMLDDLNNELPLDVVQQSITLASENDWDDFFGEFERLLKTKNYIAVGSCGLWYGRVEGGLVIENSHQFYQLLKDCDYIKVEDDNGKLLIKCSHHDGDNYYELKELTTKGNEYFTRNEYELTRKQMCEKLFNSRNYSKLPRLHEKLYGC